MKTKPPVLIAALLGALFGTPELLSAQEVCSRVITTATDRFTGAKSVITPPVKFYDVSMRNLIAVIVDSNDDKRDWELSMRLTVNESPRSLSSGANSLVFTHKAVGRNGIGSTHLTRVLIKLANDTLITLETPNYSDTVEETYENSVLTAFELSDRHLEYLATHDIAMVRVYFYLQSQTPVIETSLDSKKAGEIRNAASCFRQVSPKSPTSRAARADSVTAARTALSRAREDSLGGVVRVTGKYMRTDQQNGDYLDLSRDATFSLRQNGEQFAGSYTVHGDSILTLRRPGGQDVTGRLSRTLGSPSPLAVRVAGDGGVIWERPNPQLQQSPVQRSTITIDQVIQMVAAKLPDDVIISALAGSKFALTPEDLIRLKTAGVSDAVIRAMTR